MISHGEVVRFSKKLKRPFWSHNLEPRVSHCSTNPKQLEQPVTTGATRYNVVLFLGCEHHLWILLKKNDVPTYYQLDSGPSTNRSPSRIAKNFTSGRFSVALKGLYRLRRELAAKQLQLTPSRHHQMNLGVLSRPRVSDDSSNKRCHFRCLSNVFVKPHIF